MRKKLLLIGLASSLFFVPAGASIINITEDHTTAHVQVTYDSNQNIVNPGTTIESFSGALFPGGIFSGYHLSVNRSATIDLGGGFFDSQSFGGEIYADIWSDYYKLGSGLGTGNPGPLTGNASAANNVNLKFTVTGGDSLIDLFVANDSQSPALVSLTLYNNTLGTEIEAFSLTGLGDDSADQVILQNNHSYSILASNYQYKNLIGDIASNFGFRFYDPISVPEPSTLAFMMFALMSLGFLRLRQKQN